MQQFNDDDFQADLAAIPWDSTFVYDDIDDIWNHWSKLYKDTIDKHAPILKKRVRVKQLPWINSQIKKEIRRRNKRYKIYCRNRNDDAWSDYRVQRNLVTKLKQTSIKRFCMNSAVNATTSGGFWKRLKLLLLSSRHDNSDDTCTIDDGEVVNEPSNLFNEYFYTPPISQDALDLSLEEFDNHPSITSICLQSFNLGFSFQPVSA